MVLLCSCPNVWQSASAEKNHAAPSESRSGEARFDEKRDLAIQWFHTQRPEKMAGVAVVIHGLNFRPDKMGPIIRTLNASGIAVLNLSLRGHGDNFTREPHLGLPEARLDAFKTASSSVWTEEGRRAYGYARKKCNEEKIPLFFVGFSLGALLGSDLLASEPDVHFDRMVLFAPAFNCAICNGLKILTPFPRLVIPSFSTKTYRANQRGTPMAAYIALFDTIDHLRQNITPKLNVPTIIFIDKQDEFVSVRGLKQVIDAGALDKWQFHFLQKAKSGAPEKLHHLIIDERCLGKNMWDDVQKQMIRHLLQ